ncbi:MAG TPA: RNA polymerase sigma factor SigZ [Ktedonobacterales bacterium]|jgi:RNA polymerase sigma factor (SigZ family)
MMTTEQVWEDFHMPLRRFIRTQVRDEQQVDDLLQEVFLKIHTHLDTVRAQDKVGSWLYQIARHVITDYYRHQQSKATTALPDDLVERLAMPEEDEENEAVQSLLPCILPLVQRLPQAYRQVLLLTEVEGLPQKTLAGHLGLSFSGAKSRVQRARDKLRELLLECCHFEFDRRGNIIAYHPNCERCATLACGSDPQACRAEVVSDPTFLHIGPSRKERPMTTTPTTADQASNETNITERVRERYAQAANRVLQAGEGGCCSTSTLASGCCSSNGSAVTSDLYSADQVAGLPEEAVLASLGCGNPTALISLREGETVLDLGSGGGIDVLLSAHRVGPSGFAYGVDMTDEMLALAQANKAKAGATNVAFLKGRIEDIPLPAQAVDVVISNCVINLAADKSQVLREAFRVLKPGGRFAVSDVVADGTVPEALRRNMEAWVGCLAGALEIETYQQMLAEAGFEDISVEITRRYTVAEVGLDPATLPDGWEAGDGKLASAFVRATKPLMASTTSAKPAGRQEPLPVVTNSGGCCGGGSSCCG